jgi:hypothetical protein
MINETNLHTEEVELSQIPGYMQLVDAQRSNVLSVEKIQSVIYSMRTEVEKDLADIKETPQNWLGLISLFIPFIGIVRKWYSDQRRLYLQAQLKNFTLILNIFTNAEMVQKKLEQQMAALKETQQKYLDERRWMK